MKRVFSKIIFLLNIFVIIALFISYSSVYIPPDKFWEPSFFGLTYPFIFAANVLFVIYWLIVKPKYALLSLLAIIGGFGFISRYVQIHGKSLDSDGIKIISYNVRHFVGYEEGKPKENSKQIVDFLNSHNPDIICLQETRLRRNSIFNLGNTVKDIKSIEHYHYARSSSSYGMVTMTRYPITDMHEIRFENSGNMAIYTDIIIEKDTVRVFNVHLQSYSIDPDSYSIIESPGIDEEKDLREVRNIGGKLKRAFIVRANQAREIREKIDESPYSVIICGDFNDTPVSYAYQTMRGNFSDAFVNSGEGFGRTYVGKLPSFRIDNIFYSDRFDSYNFKTYFDFKMSDHLPISCDLVKKD